MPATSPARLEIHKPKAVGSPLTAVAPLDVSVSHAELPIHITERPAGTSPLLAALASLAASGQLSLCTPATSLRSRVNA